MGLLDDLLNEPPKPTECKIQLIFESVEEDERTALQQAVERVRLDERSGRAKIYSNQWLAKVLSDNGYDVSRSTVARHVKKECSCEQTD